MVYDEEKGHRIYLKANLGSAIADAWRSFHFATRLKLKGSVYFCSQLLGSSQLPVDLGLPLLNHRLGMWYSHAFFHELCSIYATFLQEINAIYNCGLGSENVTWQKIQSKIPEELRSVMDSGRKQQWFKETVGFRNTATHHYAVPMEKSVGGRGYQTWGQTVDELNLVYINRFTDPATVVRKNVAACEDCLKRMLAHVNEVWKQMGHQFE